MPTLPIPSSIIPKSLNPFNIKHCFLLAYWVYCSPNALKYYLYKASPKLYKSPPGRKILKTLFVKSYRNLYFCLLPTITLIATTLSLLIFLVFQKTNIAWAHWFLGINLGNLIGFVFLIIFASTFGVSSSIARGAVGGTIIGLVAGVANATALAVVLGLSPNWSFSSFIHPSDFGVVVLFSLAIGTPVALMLGGIIGGIIGIFTGVASGLIGGVVFGIMKTAEFAAQVEITGLIYAAIVGLAVSGAFGASMTMASYMMFTLAVGFAVGLSVDIAIYQDASSPDKTTLYTAITNGILATGLVWIGVFRLIPMHLGYLIYVIICSLPGIKLNTHPIAWDQLLILPLPGTQQYIENILSSNEDKGLALVSQIVTNPIQRPLAQRVLKKHLLAQDNFFEVIYRFLENPVGDSYIFAPVNLNDWNLLPTVRKLLMGELSRQNIDCTSELTSRRVENFIYGLTWLRRNHDQSPKITYCEMLYKLEYETSADLKQFDLSHYTYIYNTLVNQPGGEEICQSLNAIAEFLRYKHLVQLSGVAKQLDFLPSPSKSIRPDVVSILIHLKNIADDITISNASNSLLVQQSSLLRANSNLEKSLHTITTESTSPERRLLQLVIQQWSRLVTEAGERAGKIFPNKRFLINPYIIGTPVVGDGFIGRDDILRRITDELLGSSRQYPSIILYGHRRMGKSSILKNLAIKLQSTSNKVINFNMQVLGHVASTNEFLYALAQQIYRSLDKVQKKKIGTLKREEFIDQNPYYTFNSFFQTLSSSLDSYKFIIAVDEFEMIESKIENRQIDASLLAFLRGLTQEYEWFSLIFSGLHTLEEMCSNYWHPFFTSIPIRVSFLNFESAKQLILQTNNITYTDEVVSQIFQITNGQPYLIQLIGHTLITYFNNGQLNKRGGDNSPLIFNVNDLKKVLASEEFYTIGNAYFKGVWLQAFDDQSNCQIQILKKIAVSPMSLEELVEETGMENLEITKSFQELQNHDVLYQEKNVVLYRVELMRRWVVSHQL